MKKLATLLIIAIALAVIGCPPPQQQNAVTTEQLDAVKQELGTLKNDFATLKADFDSLKANYTAHLDKYHKAMPKPQGGGTGGTKPPPIQK